MDPGKTVIFTVEATAAHGFIPVVVKVRIALPLKPGGGVQVAVKVVALGVKTPPAGEDQIAPVAEPPIAPDNAFVVPPWHIVCPAPAFEIGVGRTLIFSEEETAIHGLIPVEVKVKIAVPK